MKRGPKPIEKPSDFNHYYFERKRQGISDQAIAQQLFVSERTFYRWKQSLGISVRR